MFKIEPLFSLLLPTLLVTAVACVLFLLGVSTRPACRRLAAASALFCLVAVCYYEFAFTMGYIAEPSSEQSTSVLSAPAADAAVKAAPAHVQHAAAPHTFDDASHLVRVSPFSHYVQLLVSLVGALLVLLAWPTNEEGTGNGGINYGSEAGEFFALMLLAIAGIFVIASANDIILFFLGLELASLPTYVMVSISRPAPIAQEAGVKYFFLGAMAAAILLLGFSYLYGATGQTRLDLIANLLAARHPGGDLPVYALLGVVLIISGLCFKIAAVPLQMYAADVYQGAATPVTAFLSFIPKTAGFVALIKVLFMLGCPRQELAPTLVKLLWIVAVLTMFFGNILGLIQHNVKRVLAYSSIAHSGYMLVGLTALAGAPNSLVRSQGMEGILFYLLAYGLVSTAAFGVMILLPSRRARLAGQSAPGLADSAESFVDLAGQGRRHVALGLVMALACFSLIGIPLTVGFLGKVMLIKPAINAKFYWLAVLTVINAALSAGYYLRIVGVMFLSPDDAQEESAPENAAESAAAMPLPILVAIGGAVLGTLILGMVPPAIDFFDAQVQAGTVLGLPPPPGHGAK